MGVTKRRWAAFLEESLPIWKPLACQGDANEVDEDYEDDVECAGDAAREAEDDLDVNYYHFGMLELSPESGVAGAHLINELLECVRIRREVRMGEEIRRLQAQIDSMRSLCARDCAVHEMASAIADYAFGEHDGLAARVANARRMFDDEFMITGAMMLALETGELAAARDLAREAVNRYPGDPMVLLQAGKIYQARCEFRIAVEVLSALFDIAERSGASWRHKRFLAFEIRDIGNLSERAEALGLDEELLGRRVDFAFAMARERGHKILGVDFLCCVEGAEMMEIEIDGFDESCDAAYVALCDELVERFGYEAYYLMLITYRSAHYESV
ncbi:MAG TPA: hypothetical protein VL424_21470, partial [Pararobbsia sp.]|nr:hypothetical protein [Pararobbsia sp.]